MRLNFKSYQLYSDTFGCNENIKGNYNVFTKLATVLKVIPHSNKVTELDIRNYHVLIFEFVRIPLVVFFCLTSIAQLSFPSNSNNIEILRATISC